MEQKWFNIKHIDEFLVFLLLCVSGNPMFTRFESPLTKYLFLFTVLCEWFLFSKQINKKCRKEALNWTIIFVIISLGQLITLGKISYLASANYVFKVLTGLFAAFILKDKFSVVYLKIMYSLCAISLILWVCNVVGIYFPSIVRFGNQTESLLIYTQPFRGAHTTLAIPRNFGMFWEPGAFSGYILVTFFLFIDKLDVLWKLYKKEFYVLIAGLISTFSTTGYIILGLILFLYLRQYVKNKLYYTIAAILMAIAMWWAFMSLDFMSNKIQDQYEIAALSDANEINYSRMGAFKFDWQYIQMHPIFGNGLINETRYSQHLLFADKLNAFGNGFSGEVAYFGIPFMLFYLISIFNNPTLRRKKELMICLILLLQGEYFMNYPLFFIFPFVHFGFPKNGYSLSSAIQKYVPRF